MDWLPLKISKYSKPNGRMDGGYSEIIVQDNNKISFVGMNKTLMKLLLFHKEKTCINYLKKWKTMDLSLF